MIQVFDCINHDILLDKLYSCDVRGNTHKMMKSYLKGRKQLTKIISFNVMARTEIEYKYDPKIIQNSVLQGTILGPLLFLKCINDMSKASHDPMVLYTDDCTIT